LPRDKTATYEKIIRCMKEEFLAFGYEKASLMTTGQCSGWILSISIMMV